MDTIAGLVRRGGGTAGSADVTRMLEAFVAADVAIRVTADGPAALGVALARDARARRPPAVAAVIAGRLDERDRLARALELDAREFDDGALVAGAYRRWGRSCVERLRGRFAVAIWDDVTRTLVVARDPIGHVPLYYHETPERLAFATAVACLVALPDVERRLDRDSLAAFVERGAMAPTATFFATVRRLPPGHVLELRGDRLSIRRHYAPRPFVLGDRAGDADYAAALRETIDRAVRKQLPSDGDAGILLSGGLDSSALACLAARHLGRDGRTLHAASSVLPPGHVGEESDEKTFVAVLERRHPELLVHPVSAANGDLFGPLESAFERVSAPVNPFHVIDRLLAETLAAAGAKVALTGFGGDAGPSFRAFGVVASVARTAGPARALALLARELHTSGRAWPRVLRREIGSRTRDVATHHRARLESGVGPATEEIIAVFASRGLVLGLPYLDLDVLELLAGVPPEQFHLGGEDRSLFRRAMEGVLPEEIRLRRDKQPYFPDYPRRVVALRTDIRSWLDAVRTNPRMLALVEPHVDLDRLATTLGRARPSRGWDEASRAAGEVGVGVVAIRFLLWFDSFAGGDQR